MNSDEELDDDCPVLVQVQEPAKDAKKVPGHFFINLLIIVRCFTHFFVRFNASPWWWFSGWQSGLKTARSWVRFLLSPKFVGAHKGIALLLC